MISKELLTEILGIEILSSKPVNQTSTMTYKFYEFGELRESSINIYELAYLCKKWAYTKDYLIDSCFYLHLPEGQIHVFWQSRSNWRIEFGGNTEPEAVFDACQWIFEQINKEKS